MNRNHRVFTFFISYSVPMLVPEPFGSGEMRRTGELISHVKTVTVIATSQTIAEAALRENPFSYPNLIIRSCIETPIDAIIETHTF